MVVTCTSKLQWGSADASASSFVTGSFSVTAGKMYVASVHSGLRTTTNPNIPTISGLGITWTQIATVLPDDASSSRARLTSFRGVAPSDATGSITTDHGSQTQDRCTVVVDEFDIVDKTTNQGIVQSNSGRVTGSTSLSVSLGAFSGTGNATYGVFGPSYAPTSTAGSGFALISHAIDAANDYQIDTEFRVNNDTGVDMSFSDTEDTGAVVMEIKVSSVNHKPDFLNFFV